MDILIRIQQEIADYVESEHLPLRKIQSWIRPGEELFEALFSTSLKQQSESELWEVVESEQPYIDVRTRYIRDSCD